MEFKKIFNYLLLAVTCFFMIEEEVSAVQSVVEINTSGSEYKDLQYTTYLPNTGGISGIESSYTRKKIDNSSGKPAYCTERKQLSPMAGTGVQTWRSPALASNQNQLAYVYDHGYHGQTGYSADRYLTGNPDTDYFITSMAVWYFTTANPDSSYPFNIFNFSNGTFNGGSNQVSQKVTYLVNDARNPSTENPSVSISASSNKMTLSGGYYVSGAISLNGSDLDANITASVSGANGVFVTNNASATSGSSSFAPGSTVYVKVPASSISSSTNITLSASSYGITRVIYEYKYNGLETTNIQKLMFSDDITKNASVSQTFSVEPYYGKVKISKTSTTGGAELPGAHLVIKNSSGAVVKEFVSGANPTEFTLAPGNYTLSETIAPSGYIKTTKTVSFTVKTDGSTTSVSMTNEPIKVKISKTDITDKKELPGAKLKVTDTNGNIVKDLTTKKNLEWTSGNSPVEFHLAAGNYILSETTTPDGYKKKTETIKFTVKENGTVTVDNKTVSSVVMTNEPIKVKISKTDITGKKELPGAVLKVTDEKGNVVKDITTKKDLTWTSGTTPKEFHLAKGNYILSETTAPKGYKKKTETIKFTVKEDGTVAVNNKTVTSVVMKDEPIIIYISKRSINGKTELPGAKLKITDKSGNLVKDLDGKSLEWVSTTKEMSFHLAAGNYILTETAAPDGYELSETKIEFSINEKGEILVDKKVLDDNRIIFRNTPEQVSPPTGSAVIYIVIALGIMAIGLTSYYVIKKKN